MKNHWLKLNEQKKNRIWTAEFSLNGIYLLKPRRVHLPNKIEQLNSVAAVTIVFKDAMIKTSDVELIRFFAESKKSMGGWVSRLRHYQSFINELEYFEYSDLSYSTVSVADEPYDIKFVFGYHQMNHVPCA